MQTKLLLALGSAAWLAMANLATADEVGAAGEKPFEGTQADASAGDLDPMSDVGSGVEYRRKDRADGYYRSGRNNRSGSDGRAGNASAGGESGGGESGGGGGDVD